MPFAHRVLSCLVLAVAVVLIGSPAASSSSTELFISEYVEGTGNNKAIEIYNGTGAPVNLAAAGYGIRIYFDNGTQAVVNLSGTIAPGDVFVLAHTGADPAILAQADQQSALGFDGDDAVALIKLLETVDVIGQKGFDPGTEWGTGGTTTANHTLRRKAGIEAGDTIDTDAFDPAVQWDGYPVDTFGGLGSHTVTPPASLRIHNIQGATHVSPHNLQTVADIPGIVTVLAARGFYMQDPAPDGDIATSEGIFVFTSVAPPVLVGDAVTVSGRVNEFRLGSTSLALTQIDSVTSLVIGTRGNLLPSPMILGTGGRVPPAEVIEDDATGNVETSGVFDPATDGIDFYESVEEMRVRVNQPVAVGPTSGFGEIAVVGDGGTNAGIRTTRGGLVIRPIDFNPERIILDDVLAPMPLVNVGDEFTSSLVGVMDYSFGNFKLLLPTSPVRVDNGLQRETADAPSAHEIVFASYNVENLDPGDGAAFARHADLIVDHLRSPDVIAIQEIQDNNGAVNDSVTDASVTWSMLIDAVVVAGGPAYEYRQIDPVDDQDGGEPGGNIRVGFLLRTDRGVHFVNRPAGGSTTPTTVVDDPSGPQLSLSPGRVDPQNPAFVSTRKSLAVEIRAHGKKIFAIVNHFSSKSGDHPLFGRFQPPQRSSEVARHGQARAVNAFVDEILEVDPQANVVVLGDLNDFEFSETVELLKGGVLTTLPDTLPQPERYTYVFEGNSQVLDQILLSDNLFEHFPFAYDVVHVNAEFADQASDHEPQVVRLDLRGRPAP